MLLQTTWSLLCGRFYNPYLDVVNIPVPPLWVILYPILGFSEYSCAYVVGSFITHTRVTEYSCPSVMGAFITPTFYIRDLINVPISAS